MLTSSQITLRALSESDADSYFRWLNDSETNATRGLYHPTSLTASLNWIKAVMDPTPSQLTLAIENENRALIGFISLENICQRSQRAELSIYIGEKSQWGKGYGSDAIRTLCRYGFHHMNLHRIWLECDAEYLKIVGAYIRIGFVQEGHLRQSYFRHGRFRDTLILGLLKTDFERTEGAK